MRIHSRSSGSLLVLTTVAVSVVGQAHADIINVPGDHTAIQVAIDAANPGDEVVIAPGIYFETINLLGKAITVRSSGGAEVTTIDAQGTGCVVLCVNGESSTTVLDGFTITGGSALEGGGMLIEQSSPTVMHCVFSDNTAVNSGGGMRINNGAPTITDCTFIGNTGNSGGGMGNRESSPQVSDCFFYGNATGSTGFGGGMLNGLNSSPTITDCVFEMNTGYDGGGLYNAANSNPLVIGCTFADNTADFKGGGVDNHTSNPSYSDCIFRNNSAAVDGGMHNDVALPASMPTVSSSLFCENVPNHISDTYIDDGYNTFRCSCTVPCPADIDGSCTADVEDLLRLLAAWGPCAGCLGDVDLSGVVDVTDLLQVLAAWGPC